MNKRMATICAICCLLLGLVAWAFGLIGGTDPVIAELDKMRGQMSDRNLTDAQRRQLRDDFRARMDSLTDDQRRAFFNNGRQVWMERAEQRMDEFFAKSAADQERQLDEMLNRMAARTNGPQRRAAGQRGGAGRGNGRSMTDAQRDERAKRRLDRSSPKMRAQFAEFRRRLDERADERGLSRENLPGRFPGGWRGRS